MNDESRRRIERARMKLRARRVEGSVIQIDCNEDRCVGSFFFFIAEEKKEMEAVR